MTEAANGMRRALSAEFVGTFALIFIGAGSAISLGVNHDPPVAFAHGLTIMVFAAALADFSGAHFNPAVTIGLAAAGQFPSSRVAPYIIAQLAGGTAAAFVLLAGRSTSSAPRSSIRSGSPTAMHSCSRRSAHVFSSARSCTPLCETAAGSRRWRSGSP